MNNITIFHLKIIIYTAVKNRSILHGRVFEMFQHYNRLLIADVGSEMIQRQMNTQWIDDI